MSAGELVPKINQSESNKLDSKSILMLKTILPDDLVDCKQLQEGGTLPNIDGYLDLLCDDGTAREKVVVQVKHLTYPESGGSVYYPIPQSIYAYAERHKGELVIFIVCDSENKKFYWRNIDALAIEEFKNKSDHIQNTARYYFKDSEKCSEDNVVKTVEIWCELYNKKMASIRDEKKLADDFAAVQKSFFNTISTELYGVANSHIARHQVTDINNWILGHDPDNDRHICLLVGEAGAGKSAVIKEVIDSLDPHMYNCLCIKADSIDDSGNNITLEKIWDSLEFYSAGKNETLLIIDQIDALSQCMSNDRSHLNVLMTMLSSLEDWHNVRAIVSCRSYDLNYDSELFNLKKKAKLIEIGELADDEVTSALNKIEKGLQDKLDYTTSRILRTVQYLNVFCILYERRKSNLNFGSSTELYDAIWEEYILKAPTHINAEKLEQTLYLIAGRARSAGTLRPILTPEITQKKYFDYLASNGLIIIEGNTVSFFHQSFYEYTLARQYSSSGRSLLNDFKDDFQGLELRSTIKSVLEYERSHNGLLFVDEAGKILSSESVRLHIKLLTVSVLAFIQNPQPAEKRLVKDTCKKDVRFLLYFLRGVQSDTWFATVCSLVKDILPNLKKGNGELFGFIGCLSRFVFSHPEKVYGLVHTIIDTETRIFSTAYILRSHNDYREKCVIDAYNATMTQNLHYTVELIKDAFQTNEKFAFFETESLIVDYLISDEKESRHNGYELVDVLFPELFNKRPKDFLLTLNSAIVKTIEKTSFEGYHGFTCTKVFSGLSLDDYTGKILKIYEDFLNRFSSEVAIMRPIIEKLLALRNETSVSMAFSAMAANPAEYDDLIRLLIADDTAISKHLTCDVEFFYFRMLKSWYLTLNDVEAARYQKQILSYKSPVDFYYDKNHHLGYYFPHLWRDKWNLICNTLPKDGLIPEMEKCSQELLRRFGKRSEIERPNHIITAAYCCGGIVSDEIYAKFSLRNWRMSFLKLDENRIWREGKHPISLSEHANAFKKCVTSNPDKFRDFVHEISEMKDVKDIYKIAGIEGLLAGGDDPLSLWSLAEQYISVEYAKVNSYSFSQIAECYVKSENQHIDDVIKVVEALSIIPFEKNNHPYSSEEDAKDIARRITDLLGQAINSYQGRAIELLIHICALPERRTQAYELIGQLEASFAEPLKILSLQMLYTKEYFDESLFFPLMKTIINDLGSEALFVRADAIQWCFYFKKDIVKEYVDRIESDPTSHKILSQIYFYGLSSETNKADCRERLEKILTLDDENVIAKLVEAAMKSYCHPEMKEYAIEILRRFADDERDTVANAYCLYCNSLPIEAFDFYCSITQLRPNKKYREIHSQIEYIRKCVSKYPRECYKFISEHRRSDIEVQPIADDEVVRVLLQIYKKLKEDEDEESMNEIMDLFDDYIYNENRMIMDAVEKMN
jgi:hypothetical protein